MDTQDYQRTLAEEYRLMPTLTELMASQGIPKLETGLGWLLNNLGITQGSIADYLAGGNVAQPGQRMQPGWLENAIAGMVPYEMDLANPMTMMTVQPNIFYHGTSANFRKFKPSETYRNIEGEVVKVNPELYFFTPEKETAALFARDKQLIDKNIRGIESEPKIKKRYLNFDNPLDLTINFDTRMKMAREGYSSAYDPNSINPYTSKIFDDLGFPVGSWNDIQMALDDKWIVKSLKDMGYDAVKLRENSGAESIAVFDSKQIKSKKKYFK